MKHLLKLLLIAVIAMPFGMQISAQDVTKVNAEEQLEQVNGLDKAVDLSYPRGAKALSSQDVTVTVDAEVNNSIDIANTVANGASQPGLKKLSRSGKVSSSIPSRAPMRADADPVTLPDGVTAEEWVISTSFFNNADDDVIPYRSTVQVAINGNDFYIAGLCYWLPNAWVKGTRNGNTVTFPSGQFFGTYSENYEFYFTGNVGNITFSYNETNHRLTLSENVICFNAADLEGNYYAYHENIVITKPDETGTSGTSINRFVPFYGYYLDIKDTESQMIYPSTGFAGLTPGSIISSITFYASKNIPAGFGTPTMDIYIGETTSTTVTSRSQMLSNRNACTLVYSNKLPVNGSSSTVTIVFDSPYIYQGGNLIVDAIVSVAGTETGSNNNNNSNINYIWQGVTKNGASYIHGGSSLSTSPNFLPKMTMEYSYPAPSVVLDFGAVEVGGNKTLNAQIDLQTNSQFNSTTDDSHFTPGNPAQEGKITNIPVTFAPTDAVPYSSLMTVVVDGQTFKVRLKGCGKKTGELVIRDKEFFEGISYSWIDSVGVSHTNYLNEIAEDPDQMIAMLKKVYTDKTIPGNLTRGYAVSSGTSYFGTHDNVVQYTGAGTIDANHKYADTYGWNIRGKVLNGLSGSTQYWYMDPEQYKPYNEGVTLLLVELQDRFSPTQITKTDEETGQTVEVLPAVQIKATGGYEQLREIFSKTIKSVRVVTEAKRTGTGDAAGTMFKVDCNHMNKFYFIAKGQLGWLRAAWYNDAVTSTSFYTEPCYVGSAYQDPAIEAYFLLGHMFEQFSPSEGNSDKPMSDAYRLFVTDMKSFGVDHDCPNVPYVENGHHFMMYGFDSGSDDCQDIRDMMFLVPDKRMMDHDERGTKSSSSNTIFQDYFKYHPDHQPSIGVFVIYQDSIRDAARVEGKDLYKHSLKWKTNLDKFLPDDDQYYELWEVVVNEFGITTYVPVYKRNANGEFKLKGSDTWVSDTTGISADLEPVILPREKLATNQEYFIYEDVYVDMTEGSQTKTYVIRGRDADVGGKHFFDLQMSNEQEVFIPGTDEHEKARMIGATYYSRYNPKNQKNCYSNRLELSNNGMQLTPDDIEGETKTLSFYRYSRPAQTDANGYPVIVNGNIQYVDDDHVVETLIATATADGSKVTVTIKPATQAGSSEYPNGSISGTAAGYHQNPTTIEFLYDTDKNGFVRFYTLKTNGQHDYSNPNVFRFWDNFSEDVSKNVHPFQYQYRMEIEGDYSNYVRVPVYKTDSKINNSFSKDEVDNDGFVEIDGKRVNVQPTLKINEDVEFEAKIQLSSKQDILRYDAYRWSDAEIAQLGKQGSNSGGITIIEEVDGDDEEDVDPTGQAGNQGYSYSVSMNKKSQPQYYYEIDEEDQPTVDTANPTNWANFIDYYPKQQSTANEYLYAPVVELWTKGYTLDDNGNLVEREDFNTYGGPQNFTAKGKFLVDPEKIDYNMSEYSWPGDRSKPQYSYYNVYLNFDEALVPSKYDAESGEPVNSEPSDYELYKVRVWRQAKTVLLGEQNTPNANDPTPDYSYRLGTEIGDEMSSYMYEDITFGEKIWDVTGYNSGTPVIESFEPCYIGTTGANLGIEGYTFGKRLEVKVNPETGQPIIANEETQMPEFVANNVWKCTFGARRVKGAPGEDDWETIEELPLKFIVRAYFTKRANLTSKAGGDDKFYVVEQVVEPVITYNSEIITGVKNIAMNKEVVGVTYYNAIGMSSSEPFDGINIVVTRYSDGTTTSTKVLK